MDRSDNLAIWIFLPAFFAVMAMLEWYRYVLPRDPAPWGMTLLAGIALLVAAIKIRSEVPKIKRHRQGQAGEMAVGQHLESMRTFGAKVFHDIPGDGFNLDHVVVCRQGLFVIETKTWSKPDKGRPVITFDGQSLTKNNQPIGDDPVIQVRAAADYLATVLTESTGRSLKPQPVLAFPGWFVEQTQGFPTGDVWALSARALPAFIEQRPEQLSDEDVHLMAYHLSALFAPTTSPIKIR